MSDLDDLVTKALKSYEADIQAKVERDLEIRLSMGSHRIDPNCPGLVGMILSRAEIDEQNKLYDAGVVALKELWGS